MSPRPAGRRESRFPTLLLLGLTAALYVRVCNAGKSRPWCAAGVGLCRDGPAIPRWDHALAEVDDKVYVYGGRRSGSALTGILAGSSLDVIDVRTLSVLALDTVGAPYSRAGHGMVPYGNGLVVFGGATTDTIASSGGGGSGSSSGSGGGGGGSDASAGVAGGLLNDVAVLDRGTLEWRMLVPHTAPGPASAPVAPQPRVRAAVALAGDKLVVVGGSVSALADVPRMVNDMWVFHLPSRAWRGPLPLVGPPSAVAALGAEGAALLPLPGMPDVMLLYGGRTWDAEHSAWQYRRRLLLLDLRTTPGTLLEAGIAEDDGGSSAPDSSAAAAGSDAGGPAPAHDAELHWQGDDLLITCAGGWSRTALTAYPNDMDESALKRWFALYRVPRLLPRLVEALAERQAAAAEAVMQAAQLSSPPPPLGASPQQSPPAASLAPSNVRAASNSTGPPVAWFTPPPAGLSSPSAGPPPLHTEPDFTILPDVWDDLQREQLFISGLDATTIATIRVAQQQLANAAQNASSGGASSNVSSGMLPVLWNAVGGGAPLPLGPGSGPVLDGTALGDDDLGFVRMARWALLGGRVLMHGGVQGPLNSAKVSRRTHVVDLVRQQVAWLDVSSKPPYYETSTSTTSLRTMLLVSPPAPDVDMAMAAAEAAVGGGGASGGVADQHLVFLGLMDAFSGQEPDFSVLFRASLGRQNVTHACRVPRAGHSADTNCFVVSAAADKQLPAPRDMYGAAGLLYRFDGNVTERDFSLTTDLVLLYGGETAGGTRTSTAAGSDTSLEAVLVSSPPPLLASSPRPPLPSPPLPSSPSVPPPSPPVSAQPVRVTDESPSPSPPLPGPMTPTHGVTRRSVQQDQSSAPAAASSSSANATSASVLGAAYIATWQPAVAPSISASLPSGTAGYIFERVFNANGSGSVHSPGPRAGAVLVAASGSEVLLFGGVSLDAQGNTVLMNDVHYLRYFPNLDPGTASTDRALLSPAPSPCPQGATCVSCQADRAACAGGNAAQAGSPTSSAATASPPPPEQQQEGARRRAAAERRGPSTNHGLLNSAGQGSTQGRGAAAGAGAATSALPSTDTEPVQPHQQHTARRTVQQGQAGAAGGATPFPMRPLPLGYSYVIASTGRRTGSSSVYGGAQGSAAKGLGAAAAAVDGDWTSLRFEQGSCAHTDLEADASAPRNSSWWFVDLGRRMPVDYVALFARSDCCGSTDVGYKDRNRDIEVRLGDIEPGTAADAAVPARAPPPATAASASAASSPVTASTPAGAGAVNPLCAAGVAIPQGGRSVVDCLGAVGRFLVVRKPYPEYLVLCEVQVWVHVKPFPYDQGHYLASFELQALASPAAATPSPAPAALLAIAPAPRQRAAAALLRPGATVRYPAGALIVFGGTTDTTDRDAGALLGDLWALDLAAHAWTRVAAQGVGPGARSTAAMTSAGSKIYLTGGLSYTSGRWTQTSDVYVLDLGDSTPVWTVQQAGGSSSGSGTSGGSGRQQASRTLYSGAARTEVVTNLVLTDVPSRLATSSQVDLLLVPTPGAMSVPSPTSAELAQAVSALSDGDTLTIDAPPGYVLRLASTLVVSSSAVLKYRPTGAANSSADAGSTTGAIKTNSSSSSSSTAGRRALLAAPVSVGASPTLSAGADLVHGGPLVTLDCGGLDVGIAVESPSVVLQQVAVAGCRSAAVLLRRPGGAATGVDPTLTVTDSALQGNTGAGLVVEAGSLSLANVLVANNSAAGLLVRQGAVVHDVERCTFQANRNTFSTYDAAMVSSTSAAGSVAVDAAAAAGNRGRGGAVSAATGSSVRTFTKVLFELNAAEFGGAVSLQSLDQESVLFSSCVFRSNAASYDGGAIQLSNMRVTSFEFSDCLFQGHSANRTGGALYLSDCILPIALHDSSFDGNSARGHGGALRADLVRSLTLTRCLLDGNNAHASDSEGGAVSHDTSGVLQLDSCVMGNNTAAYGGAVFGGDNVEVLLANSELQGNGAIQGGALMCSRCSRLDVSASNFVGNTAVQLAGAVASVQTQQPLTFRRVAFLNNSVAAAAAVVAAVEAGTAFADGTPVTTGVTSGGAADSRAVPIPAAGGVGGEVDPLADDGSGINRGAAGALLLLLSASADVTETVFANNAAVSGGGVYAAWEAASAALTLRCTAFVSNSIAGGGGAAVYSHRPASVAILPCTSSANNINSAPGLCDAAALAALPGGAAASAAAAAAPPLALAPLAQPLCGFVDNAVTTGGYGPLLASSAFTLQLLQADELGLEKESDSQLPAVVSIYDYYGQNVSGWVHDARSVVLVASSPPVVSGQTQLLTANGVGYFRDLKVRGVAGTYNVTFSATVRDRALPVLVLPVRLRRCRLGEVTTLDGDKCIPCAEGTFSFSPANVTCDICPQDAECPADGGGRALVPQDGFWHSSPWSPQVHYCPWADACTYPNRTQKLLLFQLALNATSIAALDRASEGYGTTLCAPQYKGNLCGQCNPGYGRTDFGSCITCPASAVNNLLYLLKILVTVFMIFISVYSIQTDLREAKVLRTLQQVDESMRRSNDIGSVLSSPRGGSSGGDAGSGGGGIGSRTAAAAAMGSTDSSNHLRRRSGGGGGGGSGGDAAAAAASGGGAAAAAAAAVAAPLASTSSVPDTDHSPGSCTPTAHSSGGLFGPQLSTDAMLAPGDLAAGYPSSGPGYRPSTASLDAATSLPRAASDAPPSPAAADVQEGGDRVGVATSSTGDAPGGVPGADLWLSVRSPRGGFARLLLPPAAESEEEASQAMVRTLSSGQPAPGDAPAQGYLGARSSRGNSGALGSGGQGQAPPAPPWAADAHRTPSLASLADAFPVGAAQPFGSSVLARTVSTSAAGSGAFRSLSTTDASTIHAAGIALNQAPAASAYSPAGRSSSAAQRRRTAADAASPGSTGPVEARGSAASSLRESPTLEGEDALSEPSSKTQQSLLAAGSTGVLPAMPTAASGSAGAPPAAACAPGDAPPGASRESPAVITPAEDFPGVFTSAAAAAAAAAAIAASAGQGPMQHGRTSSFSSSRSSGSTAEGKGSGGATAQGAPTARAAPTLAAAGGDQEQHPPPAPDHRNSSHLLGPGTPEPSGTAPPQLGGRNSIYGGVPTGDVVATTTAGAEPARHDAGAAAAAAAGSGAAAVGSAAAAASAGTTSSPAPQRQSPSAAAQPTAIALPPPPSVSASADRPQRAQPQPAASPIRPPSQPRPLAPPPLAIPPATRPSDEHTPRSGANAEQSPLSPTQLLSPSARTALAQAQAQAQQTASPRSYFQQQLSSAHTARSQRLAASPSVARVSPLADSGQPSSSTTPTAARPAAVVSSPRQVLDAVRSVSAALGALRAAASARVGGGSSQVTSPSSGLSGVLSPGRGGGTVAVSSNPLFEEQRGGGTAATASPRPGAMPPPPAAPLPPPPPPPPPPQAPPSPVPPTPSHLAASPDGPGSLADGSVRGGDSGAAAALSAARSALMQGVTPRAQGSSSSPRGISAAPPPEIGSASGALGASGTGGGTESGSGGERMLANAHSWSPTPTQGSPLPPASHVSSAAGMTSGHQPPPPPPPPAAAASAPASRPGSVRQLPAADPPAPPLPAAASIARRGSRVSFTLTTACASTSSPASPMSATAGRRGAAATAAATASTPTVAGPAGAAPAGAAAVRSQSGRRPAAPAPAPLRRAPLLVVPPPLDRLGSSASYMSPSQPPPPPAAGASATRAPSLKHIGSYARHSSFTGRGSRSQRRRPGVVPTYSTAIKILVSFAQVLSIVRKVNLEYPPAVRQFLAVTNSLSYSVGSFISLDCSFTSDVVPNSVQRTIISLSVPGLLALGAFFLWCILYLRLRARKGQGQPSFRHYLNTRFVVTVIVIVFYAYPAITDLLLSIYSCPRLDTSSSSEPYHDAARAAGVFWSEDYDMRCFVGWHRWLALALGVPGVVLFAIGVPTASAAFLRSQRARREGDPAFAAKWGFVYAEYRAEYYYFESVIMFRKLLMVVVIVYVGYVGVGVQVLVAQGVILTATMVHLVCSPFREPGMNYLERVSLIATSATLYMSLFFMVEGVGETARMVLSVCIMVMNTLVVFYFVYCIVREFIRHCVREYDIDGDGRLSASEFDMMIEERLGTGAFGRGALWTCRMLRRCGSFLRRSASAAVSGGAAVFMRISGRRTVAHTRSSVGRPRSARRK